VIAGVSVLNTLREVYDAIRYIVPHRRKKPDNLLGYGIPNFKAIKNYIDSLQDTPLISVFPNPVIGSSFNIALKELDDAPVLDYDLRFARQQSSRVQRTNKLVK
jgi:hypothetical protein